MSSGGVIVPVCQEQCGIENCPSQKTSMSLLLAGGAVGIEEVGAGLRQVPVEHLQHLLALDTGLQPQAEELLHLQGDRAWPEG